jgi:hypothetical protein
VDLREKLGRLPANVYKLHPDKRLSKYWICKGLFPWVRLSLNKHVSRWVRLWNLPSRRGISQSIMHERMKVPVRRRADEERQGLYSGWDSKNSLRPVWISGMGPISFLRTPRGVIFSSFFHVLKQLCRIHNNENHHSYQLLYNLPIRLTY